MKQDCFGLPFRDLGTLRTVAQRFWFSLPAVFISFCATKPVGSETTSSTVVA
jgi:hypothetical protein